MSRTGRERTKMGASTSWLYPWALERQYAKELSATFLQMAKYVEMYLKINNEKLLKGDSIHQDVSPGISFRAMIKALEGWVAGNFPDPSTPAFQKPPQIFLGLGKLGDLVSAFNKNQWGKSTKSVLGFAFGTSETWWKNMRDRWVEDNYRLIRSLSNRYIGDVNQLVEQAVVNGWGWEDLARDIKSLNKKITETRAALLARDQIGKLNGLLTQTRQEEVGLEKYVWRTANDERVRGRPGGRWASAIPSHWVMEGKICRWSDATVWSSDGKKWTPRAANAVLLHPGMAIQCRCTAIGYWKDFIEEVDKKNTS
jgi:hypothetical protein